MYYLIEESVTDIGDEILQDDLSAATFRGHLNEKIGIVAPLRARAGQRRERSGIAIYGTDELVKGNHSDQGTKRLEKAVSDLLRHQLKRVSTSDSFQDGLPSPRFRKFDFFVLRHDRLIPKHRCDCPSFAPNGIIARSFTKSIAKAPKCYTM